MSKYYGAIGYAETREDSPGVWTEHITERMYTGDIRKNTRRLESGAVLNDDIDISNEVSILADAYAVQHCHSIRYICWMGSKWKVKTVEIDHPRLRLTIGGIYNGQQA